VKGAPLGMRLCKKQIRAMPDMLKWGNAVKLLNWMGGARCSP